MIFRTCIIIIFFSLVFITCDDINNNAKLGNVEIPSADPPEGTYNEGQFVTLATTPIDAIIYYTLDGSTPNANSNKYTNPVRVELGQTLKAYAVKTNWNDSGMLTARYTQKGTVDRPIASPESGSFIFGQTATLSTTTQNAIIYYTIDGSDPSENDTEYSEPIRLESNTIIKAIAIKEGMNNSNIMTEDYIIKHIYAVGYFNDGADGYNNSLRNIACYWQDGNKIELSTIGQPAYARSIAISNGNIYVAGEIYDRNNFPVTGYWVNGQRNDILISEGYGWAKAIAVENNRVYLAVSYTDRSDPIGGAFLWVDGQKTYLSSRSVGALGNPEVTSIAIHNDTAYTSGYYRMWDGRAYYMQACYWKNGSRIDLSPRGSYATSIAVNDNNVYVTGWYNDGNGNIIPCYWLNGKKINLTFPGTTTSTKEGYANAITISNGHIYIAGHYYYQLRKTPCYWMDDQVVDLNISLPQISGITVFNGQVYIVGQSIWGRAFYWVNNNMYYFDSDSNTYSDVYGIVIAE